LTLYIIGDIKKSVFNKFIGERNLKKIIYVGGSKDTVELLRNDLDENGCKGECYVFHVQTCEGCKRIFEETKGDIFCVIFEECDVSSMSFAVEILDDSSSCFVLIACKRESICSECIYASLLVKPMGLARKILDRVTEERVKIL